MTAAIERKSRTFLVSHIGPEGFISGVVVEVDPEEADKSARSWSQAAVIKARECGARPDGTIDSFAMEMDASDRRMEMVHGRVMTREEVERAL